MSPGVIFIGLIAVVVIGAIALGLSAKPKKIPCPRCGKEQCDCKSKGGSCGSDCGCGH